MRHWSIQRRLVVIALLPAVLIAVVLTAYHIHRRVTTVEARALERARSVGMQLARVSVDTLKRDDAATLRRLMRATIVHHPNLAEARLVSASGDILARSNATGTRERIDERQPHLSVISVPVASQGPRAGPAKAAVSHVEMLVDLGRVREREQRVLWESVGLSALALALAGGLALGIGRSVTVPLRQLTNTVQRIQRGELSARPRVASGGDLGSLERGIHQMAEEMERQQESLQARMEQANHELQSALRQLEERNAELEASRLEAQAASEFKSRFLANISHEIRTPMNSIVGFAELLEAADLDAVEADYLENIRESARSLLSLLNGILDLSKIESGRMELEYVDTEINDVLIEVFHLFGPHALRKAVEFLVHPMPPGHDQVSTDPLRLKQVLINLVSNAVKFTDRGCIELGASGQVRGDGQIEVKFWVSDTGPGIPESGQTRLFQAFAQGRAQQRPRTDDTDVGTGLGLHIASEIVFLMDGSIEFHSEPGYGTTFWLTLVLPAAQQAVTREAGQATLAHVCLVDPDERTRAAYRRLLELAGCRVQAVAGLGASEPEDKASVDDPIIDAVVVHVPVSDAGAPPRPPALAVEGTTRPPVLALAHTPTQGERDRLLESGYDYVLPKTPDPHSIRRALGPLISRYGRATAATEGGTAEATPLAGIARVLVVDDHPVNRHLFAAYLTNEGIEAVAAASSDEAIYYATTQAFDAILLDIHLPDRDGLSTARAIRSSESANRFAPIVAVTADAFQDQGERAMAAGVNELLIKPVTRERLRRSLSRCLRDGSANEAPDDEPHTGGHAVSEAAATDRLPAYDHDEAVRRAAGREDVAQELFAVLQRSLPDTRRKIADALIARDRDGIRSAAHSLRGAVAYCGVPRVERAVQLAEDRALESDEADLWEATAELVDAIDELIERHGPASDEDGHSAS